MKRILGILAAMLLLTGCGGELDGVLSLRQQLQESGCSFSTVITADYGDTLQEFSADCRADAGGTLTFTVTAPETVAGITGKIEGGVGSLTFDETALTFPLLAEGQLSPVSGPWIFLKALRSGYVRSCGRAGKLQQLQIDDSYADDALQLEIWLTDENIPVRAEIFSDGRRVLTLEPDHFSLG